jgi:polysaccharide pyruvyl transferase WcaK-like protein
MTRQWRNGSNRRSTASPRVGIFGKVGSGNIGNDASMEALLQYMRSEHPGAVVDAMCTGPERVTERYDIDASPVFWHSRYTGQASSATWTTVLKVLGRAVDVVRVARWTRRHDVVMVPGAGVLEASLPMIPRGFPYSMFLMSASGKAFGTKVALVSVGAGAVKQPVTRWLFNSAARLAYYRSYRDEGARRAMLERGIDTSRDHVYPDLAFALRTPAYQPGDPGIVGVGVMDYYGTNDERERADEIHAGYVAAMKRLVLWLVDNGRQVRLLVGDTNGSDGSVVQAILTEIQQTRPGLPASSVVSEEVSSFDDVMEAMQPLGSVIAIRYHNVLCALKLSKPTIAISYSPKHDVLMDNMGLGEFCLDVNGVDVDDLIKLFTRLEEQSEDLGETLRARNATKRELLADLFSELTAVLFPRAAGDNRRSLTSASPAT